MTAQTLTSSALRPEWRVSPHQIGYPEAVTEMDARVAAIVADQAPELVWLLEHPPLYTAGTSANMAAEVTGSMPFPVFPTGRGGKMTYHGPGQRIAYVLLNLRSRDNDVRQHVCRLEEWVIKALAAFGVTGERRVGRVGIWVTTPAGEEKIAAIGVRVRHGVTLHGVSINVNPDLSHFRGIIPCGLNQYGVTSLQKLGVQTAMTGLDDQLKKLWADVFEKTC